MNSSIDIVESSTGTLIDGDDAGVTAAGATVFVGGMVTSGGVVDGMVADVGPMTVN
jgi:hypothetical protein